MELLPYWSLHDLVTQEGPLGPAQTAAVLRPKGSDGLLRCDLLF